MQNSFQKIIRCFENKKKQGRTWTKRITCSVCLPSGYLRTFGVYLLIRICWIIKELLRFFSMLEVQPWHLNPTYLDTQSKWQHPFFRVAQSVYHKCDIIAINILAVAPERLNQKYIITCKRSAESIWAANIEQTLRFKKIHLHPWVISP